MKKIILQKLVLPKEGVCDKQDLYYRRIGIPEPTDLQVGGTKLKKHNRIVFDTYFNSFSLLKWSTYTDVAKSVYLDITILGKFKVTLIHAYCEGGGIVKYEEIEEKEILSKEKKTFELEFYTNNPFGFLAYKLECLEDNSIFYDSAYTTYTDIEPRYIKIGIGICTFKRESYVYNNIKHLNEYIFSNPELKDKLEVFISDNAGTLNDDVLKNPKVHVFQNKNAGGSGGFARCMIEAYKANKKGAKLSHVLLMDDDIVFDPESIIRTIQILKYCKEKYKDSFVGGAMFNITHQNIQHASGEYFHSERCMSFITTYNNNRDLYDVKNIIENEHFTDANYQAWWFCAFPIENIREDNLSLPFFIKSDDIEFSVRNAKNIILMNGINVWHEAFDSKYSASNEYYTVRNYLVTASIHNAPITVNNVLELLDVYTKYDITNYKYREAELMFLAFRDYLAGVDHFLNIDISEYHKKIMSGGYKMVPVSELPVQFSESQYYEDIRDKAPDTKFKKFLHKLTFNGLFLKPKGFAVLGMWGGSFEQTYRKEFLVRYEPKTKKGFILRRDKKRALKVFREYKKIRRLIKRKFVKAYNEFNTRASELYNIDVWNKQLDLK